MSVVDDVKKEICFKFVYYGPGFGGKTTNMQYIYERTDPRARNKMISLANETDRELFFDFLPMSVGKIHDFDCRFYLYTTPGPVFYDSSRARILKGVDGILFVADSQEARVESNVESLEELESNLELHGYDIHDVPMVLQYNKRDLPEILSVADLDGMLNVAGRMHFESVARMGIGVFDTFKAVAKQVLDKARKRSD